MRPSTTHSSSFSAEAKCARFAGGRHISKSRLAPITARPSGRSKVSLIVIAEFRDFDLRALIEDELLMALPVAPRHEVCPEPVRLSVSDEGFEAAQSERPNPFAALLRLQGDKNDT